jgi:Acyclic terpene utilisation family protein AtuA
LKTIRIGSGAGYSGDRIEPAIELALGGHLDYLVFECLAERTIALAQKARLKDPDLGYDPMLEHRMLAVLSIARRSGTRIVTNMGAANPLAAGRKVIEVARSLGLTGLKVAAVLGDDVLDIVRRGGYRLEETGASLSSLGDRIVSANAYLGAGPILEGLQAGAHVTITGRAGDPALFAAPLLHEFGWSMNDWNRLGQTTLIGHLLECAGQITGGYFADPGFKDVASLARLGFPIGEVSTDGNVVITKVAGSGGCVTAATVKEQLLYEVHDPRRYVQPDVVADFSQVQVHEIGADRVQVTGARGTARTPTLKVSIGYVDGYIGEGQISYAGPGAVERGRLALQIVKERLRLTGLQSDEVRYELIGIDSLHGVALSRSSSPPYEVRLRVAGRANSESEAARIGNEVETLYTNGPAGGGGATRSTREVLAVQSVLLPRELVVTSIEMMES